ncbi:chromatin modification-related protein eaf-1-like [Cyclospora cayetanensis]|uniref:Chromatin modification-related protein eaf-1-like n=1 Tax=Cyclospora cayetanensis TaxID=88456 RepID=A0A6P6RRU5_9EIME|nr:chromatin modification-related protein eaf-1-like [Cyclospora cayetanensis]
MRAFLAPKGDTGSSAQNTRSTTGVLGCASSALGVFHYGSFSERGTAVLPVLLCLSVAAFVCVAAPGAQTRWPRRLSATVAPATTAAAAAAAAVAAAAAKDSAATQQQQQQQLQQQQQQLQQQQSHHLHEAYAAAAERSMWLVSDTVYIHPEQETQRLLEMWQQFAAALREAQAHQQREAKHRQEHMQQQQQQHKQQHEAELHRSELPQHQQQPNEEHQEQQQEDEVEQQQQQEEQQQEEQQQEEQQQEEQQQEEQQQEELQQGEQQQQEQQQQEQHQLRSSAATLSCAAAAGAAAGAAGAAAAAAAAAAAGGGSAASRLAALEEKKRAALWPPRLPRAWRGPRGPRGRPAVLLTSLPNLRVNFLRQLLLQHFAKWRAPPTALFLSVCPSSGRCGGWGAVLLASLDALRQFLRIPLFTWTVEDAAATLSALRQKPTAAEATAASSTAHAAVLPDARSERGKGERSVQLHLLLWPEGQLRLDARSL